MRKLGAAFLGGLLLVGASAAAQHGFDIAGLVSEGFEIRTSAPLGDGRVIVYLQQGVDAASCVVDVAAETETCRAIHGELVEAIARRASAREAFIAFFQENDCRVALGDELEARAEAFFTERGFDQDEIDVAADALFEADLLVSQDGVLELTEVCP